MLIFLLHFANKICEAEEEEEEEFATSLYFRVSFRDYF